MIGQGCRAPSSGCTPLSLWILWWSHHQLKTSSYTVSIYCHLFEFPWEIPFPAVTSFHVGQLVVQAATVLTNHIVFENVVLVRILPMVRYFSINDFVARSPNEGWWEHHHLTQVSSVNILPPHSIPKVNVAICSQLRLVVTNIVQPYITTKSRLKMEWEYTMWLISDCLTMLQ